MKFFWDTFLIPSETGKQVIMSTQGKCLSSYVILKKNCLIFANLLQHLLIKLYSNFRTVSSTNNANCYFRWCDFGVISDYFGDFVPPAYMLLWQRWRQGVWYLHGQLCLGKQCNFEGKVNSRIRYSQIEIKNNKARHKIRIVNTARWP